MENEPVIPLIPLEALVQLRQLLDSIQTQSDATVDENREPRAAIP